MISRISDGSVTSCVIHIFELFPKIERGTFVIIELASIVTVVVAEAGAVVSMNAGTANVFPCQSARKKSMVLATGGSIAGLILVVVSTVIGAVSTAFFEQENNTTRIDEK